jgi:hypothetical protein
LLTIVLADKVGLRTRVPYGSVTFSYQLTTRIDFVPKLEYLPSDLR